MRGAPKWFNTKQDVMNCLSSNNAEQIAAAKKFLQAILDNRFTHEVVREVLDTESIESIVLEDGQWVVETQDEENPNVTHLILHSIEDPNCRLFRLGFTVEEVQTLLQ